mgnify:FL=1
MAKCPKCDGLGGDYAPDGEGNVHHDSCAVCSGIGEIPDDIPVIELKDPVDLFQELLRGLNQRTYRRAKGEVDEFSLPGPKE